MLVLLMALLAMAHAQKRPHIIFILADDLGWGDVSFHGSPDIPTPNIDALAASGVVLQRYYGDRLCTPSRAALLSALYPFRLGLQHYVIRHGEPSALPLDVTTLPQHLKTLGYATHMVGKWHVGCMTEKHTPVHRGFDSFFGYYYGEIDYYDYTGLHHTGNPKAPIFFGVDLHNGTQLVKDTRGRYATELFTEKAIRVINDHDADKQPLFLYLSHLAVHIGTDTMPLQAPPFKRFPHIRDEQRKLFAGMLSALDDSVGEVVSALEARGMLDDSLVIFASDNGGETSPDRWGYSSNAPLRGQKFSMWEGGVRVPALLFSPLLLPKAFRAAQQVVHVTDWLPTLYSMAGGNVSSLGPLDGVDQWSSLVHDTASPRSDDLVLGLDPVTGQRALLREGRWKAVVGNQSFYHPYQTPFNQWQDPSEPQQRPPEWQWGMVQGVLERRGWFAPPAHWREELRVQCPTTDPCDRMEACEPAKRPCLFDLEADPCEKNNLADRHPQILQSMLATLEKHATTAAPPQTAERDPRADPRCHGFGFIPWLDHLQPGCPFE